MNTEGLNRGKMIRSPSIGLEDPCTCGNTKPHEYRWYETRSGEILGKQCIACGKEWFPKEYHHVDQHAQTEDTVDSPVSIDQPNKGLFHRLPSELDDNTACQIIGARTKIEWKLDMLLPGNHITWWRKWGYWHHAIVVEINDFGMYVIHWTKAQGRQIKIVKEFLSIDKMLDNYDPTKLYRLDYPEEVEKANDLTLVLARAFSRVGDTKYGLLSDNCESFATFCKTGREKSHQVLWLKEKMKELFIGEFGMTAAKTLLESAGKIASKVTERALQSATTTVGALITKSADKAGKKIAETAIREFTEKLATAAAQVKGKLTEETFKTVWESVVSKTSGLVKTAAAEITDEAAKEFVAKSAGKVYFAESVEKLSSTSNLVGAALVFLIEGILVAKDFYKLHKDRVSGKLTKRVFIEEATRRSVEGISAASFAVLFALGPEAIGMALGTTVGPVGTLIGGVVGGAIGFAVGKAVGTPAGRCLGRKVSKKFQDERAVNDINDLDPGDHVVLNCSGSSCHAILIEHDGVRRLQVIRNSSNHGIVEEWVDFTKPLHTVIYDEGECKDPQKVILYARLKQHEGYCYSSANYNDKTYAEECKTKADLL